MRLRPVLFSTKHASESSNARDITPIPDRGLAGDADELRRCSHPSEQPPRRQPRCLDHRFQSALYTYDLGDDWRHEVVFEAVGADDPAAEYSRFLSGARRTQPEDVGGVPGYEESVQAITRPRHREYKAMLTWHGGPYDPDDIGEAEIVTALGELARRRTLGQAAYLKNAGKQH